MQILQQETSSPSAVSFVQQLLFHFEPIQLISHLQPIIPAHAEMAGKLEPPMLKDPELHCFEAMPVMADFATLQGD